MNHAHLKAHRALGMGVNGGNPYHNEVETKLRRLRSWSIVVVSGGDLGLAFRKRIGLYQESWATQYIDPIVPLLGEGPPNCGGLF